MRDAAAVRAPGSNPALAGLPRHPLLTPSASRSSAFDGSAPSLVCGEVNLQVSSDDARLGLRRTIHLRLHMHRQSPTALTTRPPQPFAPSPALARSQSASRPSPDPIPSPWALTAALARISLQELEDDTDSITQLFLNADGTITCARG